MNKKPDPEEKNFQAKNNAKAKQFEKLERDILEMRTAIESNLDALANELMRAEARDEWMTQQITESRRILRVQTQTLDAIQTVIQTATQKGGRGLH